MKFHHYFSVLVLAVTATLANANNLETLIHQEVKKAVQFLDKEDAQITGYRYHLQGKTIHYADMNHDGLQDAVVALHYCEETSCHMTTHVFDVVVFLNTGSNHYQYADAYTLGLTGDLTVKNGVINANTLVYTEHEDPDCCPSHQMTIQLVLRNGKLVEI